MTRINDRDGCLANPRSLALEVSLRGSSSVTLLVQAGGGQHACPATGRKQGGLRVRCEGRSIYLYSRFTLSPKCRDAAGAGLGGVGPSPAQARTPRENTIGGGERG